MTNHSFGRARHIAIFLPSLEGGGAERVMVNVANWLAQKGNIVDLVLCNAHGPYRSEVSSSVRVIDFDKKRVLTSMMALVRYLRRERPDAMLSALSHANIVAIVAHKLSAMRTRLVVSERNSLVSLESGAAGAVLRRLMAFLYPSADAVVAVTSAGVEELVSSFGLERSKVVAIPNPIDIRRVQELAAEPCPHPWFEVGGPPVILAVGRLTHQKDFSTLIEAFALLRKNLLARLIILGEGPLRASLEKLIQERGLSHDVALPGFQQNPFSWMAASKLFVMSSRFEGFPNVLIQAMACGVPVVSTNCPTGPEEILEGGVWGKLVPVGDINSLATAMRNAFEPPGIPCALERVEDYAVDSVLTRYEEIL